MTGVGLQIVVVVASLVLLTTLGGARWGEGLLMALVGGLVFPVTWVVWFVRDNHSAGRRAFVGH
ncbi:hypothetical protein [uncultured Jatrophihabitans sp.]|uniref:hypothetical protein n=1 Tax=uncultured Jatrophihabitans sp. TaxID=1610747 RepID=UPI0035C9BAB8